MSLIQAVHRDEQRATKREFRRNSQKRGLEKGDVPRISSTSRRAENNQTGVSAKLAEKGTRKGRCPSDKQYIATNGEQRNGSFGETRRKGDSKREISGTSRRAESNEKGVSAKLAEKVTERRREGRFEGDVPHTSSTSRRTESNQTGVRAKLAEKGTRKGRCPSDKHYIATSGEHPRDDVTYSLAIA